MGVAHPPFTREPTWFASRWGGVLENPVLVGGAG
jgi:hypothetical protein